MKNPFSFSSIAEDPAFCNREKEQADMSIICALYHIFHTNNVKIITNIDRIFLTASSIHGKMPYYAKGYIRQIVVMEIITQKETPPSAGSQANRKNLHPE